MNLFNNPYILDFNCIFKYKNQYHYEKDQVTCDLNVANCVLNELITLIEREITYFARLKFHNLFIFHYIE